LKNGDLVELDATTGTITILEPSNSIGEIMSKNRKKNWAG
jgi:dihydroxyacid dehydratase/phosphogluconate dehydratase